MATIAPRALPVENRVTVIAHLVFQRPPKAMKRILLHPLFLLCLAICTAAIAIQQVNQTDREQVSLGAARSQLVLGATQDRVRAIRISVPGMSETIIAERSGAWFFQAPSVDRVHPAQVAGLLTQLTGLRVKAELSAEEIPTDAFSDDKTVVVEVSLGEPGSGADSWSRESIRFGLPAATEGDIYVETTDGRTALVQTGLRENLMQAQALLLDRRLLGPPVSSIVQMAITVGKDIVGAEGQMADVIVQRQIVPEQTAWQLVHPIAAWANQEAVEEFLSTLASMEATDITASDSAALTIPSPLPAGDAVLSIRTLGLEQPIQIYLKTKTEAQPLPAVEARASDRPGTFQLETNFIAQLPQLLAGFRDRSLGKLSLVDLSRITIQSRMDPPILMLAQRESDRIGWSVRLNNELERANVPAVQALVEGFNESQVIRFIDDPQNGLAVFGLEPPARRITFESQIPDPEAQGGLQSVTTVLNLGLTESDGTQRLFANFAGQTQVSELDPTFLSFVPSHPIKWKSLNVFSFAPSRLVEIEREVTGREVMNLRYDRRLDSWSAERDGLDATNFLDRGTLSGFRDRLSSLTATTWLLRQQGAFEALQKPTATIRITVLERDVALGQSAERSYTLRFAPTPSGRSYFCRIDDDPDLFTVSSDLYRDLTVPLTQSSGQ